MTTPLCDAYPHPSVLSFHGLCVHGFNPLPLLLIALSVLEETPGLKYIVVLVLVCYYVVALVFIVTPVLCML